MADAPLAAPEDAHARFPCEECGAALAYAPGEGATICPYCGTRNEIAPPDEAAAHLAERDLRTAMAGGLGALDDTAETFRALACDACGAEIRLDDQTEADRCPFCAAPFVAPPITETRIRPAAVAPFALKEGEARDRIGDWLGSLWFAPSDLKRYARAGRPLSGVYAPYWTYDADTDSRYTGMRGDAYYVTRTSTGADGKTVTRKVRKIRWSPAAGRVKRFFDDVLIVASASLPKKYVDAVAPFTLAELRPYNPVYLAGFRAEVYTRSLEDGLTEAQSRMDAVIRRDVRFDIGGDQQKILTLDTDFSAMTFKHVLLPLWIASFRYRGQVYRLVVNGQTGLVAGERPWSKWKIAFAVLAGLILAGGAAWLYAQQGR